MEQVAPVPVHPPPDHPAKNELVPAVAVRVTWVPSGNPALQVGAQLMPVGVLVTLPVPVPVRLTLKTGNRLKVAVTELLAFKVTEQPPEPLHPLPVQPTKYEFAEGVAVRVT
jgi:hypothetical protein